MSASRSVPVFLAAAVGALLLLAGTATTADPGLEQQLVDLGQRVATLEGEMATLKTSVRASHPDPAMEQAATAELSRLVQIIGSGDAARARTEMASFMAEYGSTRAGQQGRTLERELSATGRPAPEEWTIDHWYQGETEIDLHGSGPTLVVFWETWCPHCRREVPDLQRTYESYRTRGLQVLALTRLTRGATDDTVQAFIDEHELGFPVAKETGALSAHFAVSGIPAAAVVLDGEVVWRGHPARLPESTLESWLQ